MKICNNFSSILKAKNLKISEVFAKTGISRTTLTKLFYGEGEAIYFNVLEKLCNYLSCDIQDVFKIEVE